MSLATHRETLTIPVDSVELKGDLAIPEEASGVVLFAHASGTSRLSPLNRAAAEFFNKKGMATFLFDLLSYSEDREYTNRLNLSLLTHRLTATTKLLLQTDDCRHLQPAYFGSGTGAAAALKAASELSQVAAVASRGGRPDLVTEILSLVKSPTLLIVGGLDEYILHLNQLALNALTCEKRLIVVEGASHLFEETGAMGKVNSSAASWFEYHFTHSKIIQ